MDKKIIAIAVVAILVVAIGVSFIATNDKDDSSEDQKMSAIARVNTEGSGIYLKANYTPSDFYTKDVEGKITLIPEAWGGKVFGTPGTASIQHVQLQELVQDMGFKFIKYDNKVSKSDDTVYYIDSVTSADAAINKMSNELDGGIIWQPQYVKITDDEKYQPFLLTNDLFPGHTCCIIAGYTPYIEANKDVTVAFLAGYAKAVDYINDAKKDKTSDEYKELLKICVKYTSGLNEKQIDEALDTITYVYSDDSTGTLDKLTKDIASLEKNLASLGSIKVPLSDLGFKNETEFAEKAVDDSFLKDALGSNVSKVNAKIKITAITGDIHQIGLRVADELGFFEEYGVDVDVNQVDNGSKVAQELLSGNCQFGFLGAPPFTTNSVNQKAVTA